MTDLYEQAKKIILLNKKPSVSLLQRKLNIGYCRASRMLDRMYLDGLLEQTTHQEQLDGKLRYKFKESEK